MIRPWIKGTIESSKKEENAYHMPGHPKDMYRTLIKIEELQGHPLPPGRNSYVGLDIYEPLPVGARVEFIYEIGEPDA